MRPPSSPSIPLFLLLFAGFLISGVLTPSVSEAGPEVSSIFRDGLRSLPSPPPPPLLPYGSSGIDNLGNLSDSPQALPDSYYDRSPAARSLLCSDVEKHDRFLLALPDGTIYSMDSRSRVPHWKLVTGSPFSYSEQADSNIEYFIYSGDNGHLYEYSKVFGYRELNSTIEELVHRTPEIKGTMITLGSKVTTSYLLDATTGEILLRLHLPVTWTEVGVPWVEEKSVLSKLETDKSYIVLVRTDYTLSSTDLGRRSWLTMESRISATNIRSGLPPNIGDELILSSLCQIDIPVFFPHTASKSKGAIYEDPMLPSTSYSHYPFLNAQNGKQASLMLPNPCKTANCSPESGPSGQSIAKTCQSSESHFKTDQIPKVPGDEHIFLNSSNDVSNAANDCLSGNCVADKLNVNEMYCEVRRSLSQPQNPMNLPHDNISSITQNLYKDANSCLVENFYSARQNFNEMLPGAIYGIFAWFMIPFLLIILAFCYPKFREAVKHNGQLNNLRGKQSIAPKKRKARKAGNMKNGAVVSNYEKFTSAEKEIAETNGHTRFQSDELHSFTNLYTSVDAGDGRWVGKLFVSNSEIGRGSNGTVVLEGVYDGRPVAVKRLLRAHHDVAFKEIQNLIASDRHPNIVRWYGAEQDLDFVYISLERCSCSLSDLIQPCSDSSLHPAVTENPTSSSINEHKVRLYSGKDIKKDLELWTANGFPSSQLLKLMRDVVSGLAHLHELGIIHRDMKPQNVLISNDMYLNAKLSDMGISKRLLEDMSSLSHHTTGYGSSGWQAPEQLLHGRQTRAVDLFSLGCILFFCITKGRHPFGNHFERDSNIVNNRIDLFLVDHIPEAVHLLSQLLDPNPQMRPNAVEVLHHPLFWSSEMRLTFLRDTSDRVELEDRENESELLKALENVAPVAFGGKWGEKLDTAFITDMGRYRKYNFDCVRDLLRVIRNKLNHYRELKKDLQEILGPVPEGFDRYFSSRFPKLLIEVYQVVSRYCREEECFSKYFKSSLV